MADTEQADVYSRLVELQGCNFGRIESEMSIMMTFCLLSQLESN
jgi:hypothetical protein